MAVHNSGAQLHNYSEIRAVRIIRIFLPNQGLLRCVAQI